MMSPEIWLVEQTRGWVCSWREHLAGESAADTAAELRLHENTGRPLGSEQFVKRLEQALGRRLTPGRPGRPRKGASQRAIEEKTV